MSERDIFLAVIDIPDESSRSAYLDAACKGDPALRRRIETLLRSHDSADSFLDSPAVSPDIGSGITQELGDSSDTDDARDHDQDHDGDESPETVSDPLSFLDPPQRRDSLGRLGHYDVLQILGQGGFATVFRVFDDVLQRVVAMKVMSPQLAAASPARKRFLREARSSAKVRHENVVQIYEVQEQPLPYLVMEFIPGETLQQRLDRTGPLDVRETLCIGRQIAEGLAAAHANGLIHRDIKPGNILVEGGLKPCVKITDFGLARAADDASMTKSGTIAGTPLYMAPEQAEGETLDQRADLFSFGSVLYQMVTGRPPFRASTTLGVLKRVAEDDPRSIREIIPETPRWLCDIIGKLHQKKPGDRIQTAREVADLFADCEEQLKASSRITNPPVFASVKPASPQRRWWIGGALVASLFVIAAALIAPRFSSSDPAPKTDNLAAPIAPAAPTRFALRFDGVANTVEVPKLRLDGLHEFTIDARVRWGGRRTKGTIVVSLGDPLFALDIDNAGDVVPYLLRGNQPAHTIGARIHDTGWHDLAVTVEGTKVAVFVDGRRQTTTAPPGATLNNITPPRDRFMIGGGLSWDAVPSLIYPFQGDIGALRVSRGIRYTSNFAPGPLPTDENTLALYRFDEGQGDVLRDSSGNGRDGVILGATWIDASAPAKLTTR